MCRQRAVAPADDAAVVHDDVLQHAGAQQHLGQQLTGRRRAVEPCLAAQTRRHGRELVVVGTDGSFTQDDDWWWSW